LKLAIFAPRLAFGSVVEIVENVVGDSVYVWYSFLSAEERIS